MVLFVIYFNYLVVEIITKKEHHHNSKSLFFIEKIDFWPCRPCGYYSYILADKKARMTDAQKNLDAIESHQKNRETLVFKLMHIFHFDQGLCCAACRTGKRPTYLHLFAFSGGLLLILAHSALPQILLS